MQQRGEPAYPFSSGDLLSPEALKPVLAKQAEQLGHPNSIVTGTLFAKRYSVLVMGLVAAFSLFDCILDIKPDNIRFKLTKEAEMEYQILQSPIRMLPAEKVELRSIAAADFASALFLEHIKPVFAAVSVYTGAKLPHMWSLVSHNLQNLFLRLELQCLTEEAASRRRMLSADRELLLAPLLHTPSAVFENPLALKLRSFSHETRQDESFYLRRHCCLAYRLSLDGEAHGNCLTCPKATVQERLAKWAEEC
ncbi:IucA/IucC family C-terminal-domain containing protein [Paenibacillus algorifonticola]|nr:IucA/IucC family C-terminal-domain containing protein [Paenibacillus algorifonticola]